MVGVEWGRTQDGRYILKAPSGGWPKGLRWYNLWRDWVRLIWDWSVEYGHPGNRAVVYLKPNKGHILQSDFAVYADPDPWVTFVSPLDALRWAKITVGEVS
jgi:hypothetical protein